MADNGQPHDLPNELAPTLLDRLLGRQGGIGPNRGKEQVTTDRKPIGGQHEMKTAGQDAVFQDFARVTTPGGFTGPRGKYDPEYPGLKETQAAGVPPVLAPIEPFKQLPKDKAIPKVPYQMERYGDVPVSKNSGAILHNQVAFPWHTVQIDNYSRVWLFVPAAQRFVPPFVIGVQYPIFAASGIIRVEALAPPNWTQPAAGSGDVVTVTMYEAMLDYSNGIAIQDQGGAPGGGGGATTLVAGTKTPADATANPTDAVDTEAFSMVWNGATWDRMKEGAVTGSVLSTPAAAASQSAMVTTTGALMTTALNGQYATGSVQIDSTGYTGANLAFQIQFSYDGGLNYINGNFFDVANQRWQNTLTISSASIRAFPFVITGATHVQVNITSFTSGGTAPTVYLQLSTGGAIPQLVTQGLADAVASPSGNIPTAAFGMAFNGTNWDRVRGSNTGATGALATTAAAPTAANMLDGFANVQATATTTLVTVPSGRTWIGYVGTSCATSVAAGGAASTVSSVITTANGTGTATPTAGSYARTDVTVAAVGTALSSDSATAQMAGQRLIVQAAAGTALIQHVGTIVAGTGPQASGWAIGELM